MRRFDYLVIGQGLAGTFLSWYLLQSGKEVMVIDHEKDSSASQVAAGIIHPITGRRIVKTWMADTLLPFARNAYEEIESALGIKVFSPVPIIELISTPAEYNEWMSRSGDPGYEGYIETTAPTEGLDEYLNYFYKKILIRNSSRIDIGTLLVAHRSGLLRLRFLQEEVFDPQFLKLTNEGVEYRDLSASMIIFCEGSDAVNNVFWSGLPFLPVKGEVLTIEADMKLDYILNRKCYLLQTGEKLFKAGSTYTWNFTDSKPTTEAREFLMGQLKSMLKIPFKVVDQKAGIRPAVKNRRPFIGVHPEHRQVGIFNGLGTKGCLLAPWFAKHFADYLIYGAPLLKDVDVKFRMEGN